MRQILIASGKGGTGKTSLTAALAATLSNKAVLADLDVDASNLPFLVDHETQETHDFFSGVVASVDGSACIGCGKCEQLCKFDAVKHKLPQNSNINRYYVIDHDCEGCGVCARFCPANAIRLEPRYCGTWSVSSTNNGLLVHAELSAKGENSGRLVSLLRKKALELANTKGFNLVLADGAPGIGCPVISGMTGMDYALLVTEASPAGLHDLKRIHDLCNHFKVACGVIINKHDLNPGTTGEIVHFCKESGLECLGKIPFFEGFATALHNKTSVLGQNTQIDNIIHHIANRLEQVTQKGA